MATPETRTSQRRLVLLVGRDVDGLSAKTAVGMLRYRPQEVACVLREGHRGGSTYDLVGVESDAEIVSTVSEALSTNPSGLLVAMAAAGGKIAESWKPVFFEFVKRGLDIDSGLHEFVGDIPGLRTLANRTGSVLTDLRRPPEQLSIGCGRALDIDSIRVLTVGTDECCGKMTAALELHQAAKAADWSSRFIATGQTGIAIGGYGVAVDAVVADFAAGVTEQLVLDSARYEVLFVEGQGAITSPCFSGVALSLLHGVMPDALVLCHDVDRTTMRGLSFRMPSFDEVAASYEAAMRPFGEAPIVALCLNTSTHDKTTAQHFIRELSLETGLAVTDPVRFGVRPILEQLETLR